MKPPYPKIFRTGTAVPLLLTVSALLLSSASLMAAPNRAARKDIPETGPKDRICFAMYTTHASILKMNVQFYPLLDSESRQVVLEIKRQGNWEKVGETEVLEDGHGYDDGLKIWLAQFRVEGGRLHRTQQGAAVQPQGFQRWPLYLADCARFLGRRAGIQEAKPDSHRRW